MTETKRTTAQPGKVTMATEGTSVERNKQVIRRYIDEFINQRNQAVLEEVYSPRAVIVQPGQESAKVGYERIKELDAVWKAAFPDVRVVIEDIFAEGDKVVIRGVVRGTQQGAFLGVPASNKQLEFLYTTIFQLEDGKIVRIWDFEDLLGMFKQIGRFPQ